MNEIATGQLEAFIGDHTVCIIDVRPIDAYNGWALEGERRGGHIKGARAMPTSWLDQEDWEEMASAKGAVPDRRVIVYGYSKDDAQEVAEKLGRAGCRTVSVYTRFVDEWSADLSLPMERMARFEKLVPPRWVRQLVSGQKPPGLNGEKYAVCHCHYRNQPDYDTGHIPGAISLDTLELESPDTWNCRSPEELERALLKLGITADTTVVVYGRFSSPRNTDPHPGSQAGHLGSIRCGVIMMYAGVRDVRVLNGGIAAWGHEDLPLTTDELRLEPAAEFGRRVPARPKWFIDTPRAKEVLRSDHENLISVRSWDEFIGKVSGYNYIFKKGRIPGAVFGNCGSDAYHASSSTTKPVPGCSSR